MPIALDVRIVVRMNSGVILFEIWAWTSADRSVKRLRMKDLGDRFSGFIHRVPMKRRSREAWMARRAMEKLRERNTSSLTNFQFTVHSYLNWRERSKARER